MKKAFKTLKTDEVESKRVNDPFMRKILWYLGGLVLASAGAILVMQVQISNNTKANEILGKISISIQTLIDSGAHRNDLLSALTKKTEQVEDRLLKVYGEQQRRGPRITRLEKDVERLRKK